MDRLKRSIWISVFFGLAVACSKQKSPEQVCEECFTEPANVVTTGSCGGSAIENQFLVTWESGRHTVVQATRDEFVRTFLEPNLSAIKRAQYDRALELDLPEMQAFSSPFDPQRQWGLERIEAKRLWDLGFEGERVSVAVIDSGVDYDHFDLRQQIAINDLEIPNNGTDDDGNGFIDDHHGCGLFGNGLGDAEILCNDPADPNGHGTHVAGIIASSQPDKPSQSLGVAPKSQIVPISFLDEDGRGTLSGAVLAINYARVRQVNIINASWGGPLCGEPLADEIKAARDQGILFVAAAGNSGRDLEDFEEYPARFSFSNMITVGASTERDVMASFSNYSLRRVHLLAPGAFIYSTVPRSRHAMLSGTSMAAPYVSGAAALLKSAFPDQSMDKIREALFEGVDVFSHMEVLHRGRLNVFKSYQWLKGSSQ